VTAVDESRSEAAAKRRDRIRGAVLETLALFGPIGIVASLFYYYGYVSTKAFYSHFGVNLGVSQFSTESYLVLAADTLFRPIITILVILAGILILHFSARTVLFRMSARWAQWIAFGVGLTSASLAAVGLLSLNGIGFQATFSPLALAVSAILIEYSVWVANEPGLLRRRTTALTTGKNLRRGLLVAIATIAVFWSVTDLAVQRGRSTAEIFELSLPLQPQAVIYSEKDLQLSGPGIGATKITKEGSSYNFRYNGLRQLLYVNQRWFLLPVGWTRSNGTPVIVLPDNHSGSRVDLAPSS
jgi:hypothetical protein